MRTWGAVLIAAMMTCVAAAQQTGTKPTALTIYNQDFALARTIVSLELKGGLNEVTTTRVTSQLEPDSVVLRDPSGKLALRVTEQNYDAGLVSQEWMLEKYEGKTIQFQWSPGQTVEGKIIRAGQQPLIEVKGVMQFQLPGTPLFPAATDGLLLKPTLRWVVYSPKPAHVDAELAYITHGMNWQATYNVVVPETNDMNGLERGEVVGWITIQNNSGTEFPEASIKLMAGDVAKLRNLQAVSLPIDGRMYSQTVDVVAAAPGVTQKAFDNFHLYDLNRTVTLRSGETKQVEFLQATNVEMIRVYEYDGSAQRIFPMGVGYHNDSASFGTESLKKVTVQEEISNSEANHLGIPIPAGRIRLYRRDAGGQMEFVGENLIGHTPAKETLRLAVGSAFDVTGERKQTDFHVDSRAHTIDESYEINLKNQKEVPVTVKVIEHFNRGHNWELKEKPSQFAKRDSNTIEIPVIVYPHSEAKLSYSVRYTWLVIVGILTCGRLSGSGTIQFCRVRPKKLPRSPSQVAR
jgi:hypothetical protein